MTMRRKLQERAPGVFDAQSPVPVASHHDTRVPFTFSYETLRTTGIGDGDCMRSTNALQTYAISIASP
jgi:hypothetical protein